MSIQQIKSGVIADDAVTAEKVSVGAPYWDASGNVGIGEINESSPLTTLDVRGASTVDTEVEYAGFRGGGSSQPYLRIGGYNATVSADRYAFINSESVNGTGQSLAFQTDGTERGRFDISGNFLFNSGFGSVATAYGCRAWVKFDGAGAVSIFNSGNVSSISDNGTGDYGINFATAMPDNNYAAVATFDNTNILAGGQVEGYTTTKVDIRNSTASNTIADGAILCVVIFR